MKKRLGSSHHITDEAVIADWMATGTIIHVCVDNQKNFASPDEFRRKSYLKALDSFGRDLGSFTGYVGKHFPTIDIMSQVLPAEAFIMTMHNYQVERVNYDPVTLTVDPDLSEENKDRLQNIWMDLFDTNYAEHIIHVKSGCLWQKDNGRAVHLHRKLSEFENAKYFVTGLYGEYCVPEFIDGIKGDAEIMIDPSLIWSVRGARCTSAQILEDYKNKGVIVTDYGAARWVMEKMAM